MYRKNRSKPWFLDCKDEKRIHRENRVRTIPQQAGACAIIAGFLRVDYKFLVNCYFKISFLI